MKGKVRGLLPLKLILDSNYKQKFQLREYLMALQENPESKRIDIVYASLELSLLNQVIEQLELSLYGNKIDFCMV